MESGHASNNALNYYLSLTLTSCLNTYLIQTFFPQRVTRRRILILDMVETLHQTVFLTQASHLSGEACLYSHKDLFFPGYTDTQKSNQITVTFP